MIYLVDICDTLYRSNTTFDFIRYLVRRNPFKRFLVAAITLRYSPPFWILLIAGKVIKKDLHRACVLMLIRGMHQAHLMSEAVAFNELFLEKRRNEIVWRHLKDESTNQVILLSATLEPIALAIANKNGFEVCASKLEYDLNGRFTGRLKIDLIGRKHEHLPYSAQREQYAVITDNFSDQKLLESAAEKFVVLNQPRDRKKWSLTDATFILNYE
jgi:phosphoserine phosphatase